MGCCVNNCRNKTITPEQEEKDNEKSLALNEFNLNLCKTNNVNSYSNFQTHDSLIHKQKAGLEDFYFARPMWNSFTKNELLSMNIEEIIFGVHPTLYKKGFESFKSFHPFFYLKLDNDKIENFGVIVQYIKVPEDVSEEQHHLYEENGVEFIEKNYEKFENELKLIFYDAEELNIPNISDYVIRFSSFQFDRMTLGDFFKKAIPEEGIWIQDKLKRLEKTCFDFCKNAIEKINVRKKKKNAIEKIKKNLSNIIDKAKDAKYYDKYIEGFEAIFNVISE